MGESEARDQLQTALGASYILERELGRGGMATVYVAHDLKHDRPVALKVLHPELAAALGPERFRREITLAARLQHAHIVSVYDSGQTPGGLLWFTMPYVEGESLRARLLRERQLPVDQAVGIAREVAVALDYAHRHGVVHRDIKPENILLSDGQALIADFGIARALTPESPAQPGATLTDAGTSLGTPAYMSPEQASGERELDARTDVYSLAVVLYEMLAGEPPFTGPTAQAIMARRFTERPRPLRTVRETIPESVERAVDTALARAPADRFATAGDFAKSLAATQGTAAAPLAATSGPASPVRRRRVPVGAALLGLGFLIGVGVLFAWRSHGAGGGDAAGPTRLAVLPFDNVGDSADAYFADGLTDAVRDKLAAVPGLQVIASGSSGQYRHTTKTPQQIGQELGVRYLLVGKVRWAKAGGAGSRVEVRPELVEVASAADKWGAPFDAPLTDVFQVQADIAGKVVEQLKVALTPTTERVLTQRPTTSLDAYDAFLRGRELEKAGNAPVTLHRAAVAYGEAVGRDSAFALAWAGMAATHALAYTNGAPTRAEAEATRVAAERAVALAPDLPEAHAALGLYYAAVQHDNARAFAEYQAGLRVAPSNGVLLRRIGILETHIGRWDSALAHLQQTARLDPRSFSAREVIGNTLLRVRRLPEAASTLDRAIVLDPTNVSIIEDRAMVSLAQGDLAGARAIFRAAPAALDSAALVAYMATYFDIGWALDSTQQRFLLTLPVAAFDDDRAQRAIDFAQAYALRGDAPRTRAYADTARLAFDVQLKAVPDDPGALASYALALAYLGRRDDAIRAGQRLVAPPASSDSYSGPYYRHQLARIYIILGQPDKALDTLEPLLTIPYYLTPEWLRIDPNFAPLHGNARFERLVASSPAGGRPTT